MNELRNIRNENAKSKTGYYATEFDTIAFCKAGEVEAVELETGRVIPVSLLCESLPIKQPSKKESTLIDEVEMFIYHVCKANFSDH